MRRVLALPRPDTIESAIASFQGAPFRWLYLGGNAGLGASAGRILTGRGIRVDVGPLLQRKATSWREAYCEYVGARFSGDGADCRLLNSILEKNPYVSKAYLRICHLGLLLDVISGLPTDARLLVIVEDSILRNAILSNDASRGVWALFPKFDWMGSTPFMMLTQVARFLIKRSYFLLKMGGRIALARYLFRCHRSALPRRGPLFVLHSWVDHRSFNEEHAFKSNNYGSLGNAARLQGRALTLMPRILPSLPFLEAMRHIRRSKDCFLVPEAFLTPWNLLHACLRWAIQALPDRLPWPDFDGVQVQEILRWEDWDNWSGNRGVDASLYFYIISKRINSENSVRLLPCGLWLTAFYSGSVNLIMRLNAPSVTQMRPSESTAMPEARPKFENASPYSPQVRTTSPLRSNYITR